MKPITLRRLVWWMLPLGLLAAIGAVCFRHDALAGALLDAVSKDDQRRVAALLTAGADPNARDDGPLWPRVWGLDQGGSHPTALHIAVFVDKPTEVLLLLRNGGRVDARDASGETPLMWAAAWQ